jgi:hypothetical protein
MILIKNWSLDCDRNSGEGVVVRMAEEGKLVDDEEVEASETRVES